MQLKIGEAVATRLAAEGASRGRRDGVAADVSTVEGVESDVQKAIDEYGHIHLFFNNAGIEGQTAPMREWGEGGAIVNTSSVAGLRGSPDWRPPWASKHGVMGLTKAAVIEAAEFGVRVNATNPGPITTGMMDRIELSLTEGDDQTAVHDQFASLSPMVRYGTPEEVANLVAWLLSDEASYSTGGAYVTDGGLTAS